MGDCLTIGDLWIMGDFSFTGRGGESTQTNKQTHTHINTRTQPGLGAGAIKNYTNTKHWKAEIQMTYM